MWTVSLSLPLSPHRPPTSPVARCAALPFIGCLLSFCLAVGSCFGQLRARFLPISNFHFNYYEYYSENQASGNIGDPLNTSPHSSRQTTAAVTPFAACRLPLATCLRHASPSFSSLFARCVCVLECYHISRLLAF